MRSVLLKLEPFWCTYLLYPGDGASLLPWQSHRHHVQYFLYCILLMIMTVSTILLVSNLTSQMFSCNCVVSTKQDLFKIKERDQCWGQLWERPKSTTHDAHLKLLNVSDRKWRTGALSSPQLQLTKCSRNVIYSLHRSFFGFGVSGSGMQGKRWKSLHRTCYCF